MLNKLWGALLLIGIVVATGSGKLGAVGTAAIDGSKDAVTLCVTMLGVMSLWTGIMNIAKKAGLMDAMTRAMRPAFRFLFPGVPPEHQANEYIAANLVANILGLGWAATPYGLKAMEKMRECSTSKYVASKDMCTFLILNISSLQLIPVSVIAYRSEYGSANPTAIIGLGMAATFVSTAVGILFAIIMRRVSRE